MAATIAAEFRATGSFEMSLFQTFGTGKIGHGDGFAGGFVGVGLWLADTDVVGVASGLESGLPLSAGSDEVTSPPILGVAAARPIPLRLRCQPDPPLADRPGPRQRRRSACRRPRPGAADAADVFACVDPTRSASIGSPRTSWRARFVRSRDSRLERRRLVSP